ncbi:MAG: Mrp/NBP35 family ATP-binding protein [Firmicutes bacterium]|jgi:Mrp family chromosome partitioning ATPase|nr:Mrp/NBP35 family ATP-binding protein [Bacillota bacterium]
MKGALSAMASDTSQQKGKIEKISRPEIKHVIAVGSGKGGVGKSSITALLAVGARKEGFKAGILDADITGPSIPKMFGLKTGQEHRGFLPFESSLDIKIMSLNLLLQNEDDPVIWRGPLIGGAIKQFWADVEWGELDYLFIDLPPGTADAPLTVMQIIPLDGLVIVSSPQDLALMVVKKALKMAEAMNVPVMGLVENMSYLICPHCMEKVEVFGPSKGEEISKSTGVPLLDTLPLDKKLAELCDNGSIEQYESELFKKLLDAQHK